MDRRDKYCPYCMSRLSEEGPCPSCGLTSGTYMPMPHHLPPGTVLMERYLVGRVLGEGGFGITYIGCDLKLELKVAIKEYFPTTWVSRHADVSQEVHCYAGAQGNYDKGRRRFLYEARTMAKMDKTAGDRLRARLFRGQQYRLYRHGVRGRHDIQGTRDAARRAHPRRRAAAHDRAALFRARRDALRGAHPPRHQPRQPDAGARRGAAAGLRLRARIGPGRRDHDHHAQARLRAHRAIPAQGPGPLDGCLRPFGHHLLLPHGQNAAAGARPPAGRRPHPPAQPGRGPDGKAGARAAARHGDKAASTLPERGRAAHGPLRGRVPAR